MNTINRMEEDYDLAGRVIGLAMKVHSALGPGFLESVYENALAIELEEANIKFNRQCPLAVQYRKKPVGDFLCDIVIEDELIIELKATQNIAPAHEVQLVNYLTATNLETGLLLNFGSTRLQYRKKYRTYQPTDLHSVHSVNSVLNPNQNAFTILELLVAMAVFSLLIVMLMGMVDSASKLWRENESRVDSYREARAAMNIISRDLGNAMAGTNLNYIRIDTNAYPLLADAEKNPLSASAIFFLSAQTASAQDSTGNKSDVCQVGYFLAYGKSSALSGVNTANIAQTMNLYRYFLSSDDTFAKLTNGAYPIFEDLLGPLSDKVELLARNIKSFRLTAVDTNGSPYNSTTNAPLPPVVQIEMVALNAETAKKLISKSDWTSTGGGLTNVVGKNQQTFNSRVRLNNNP